MESMILISSLHSQVEREKKNEREREREGCGYVLLFTQGLGVAGAQRKEFLMMNDTNRVTYLRNTLTLVRLLLLVVCKYL